MDIAFINSKIAVIKIPSEGFIGDQIELEKYAEHINQYGKVKNVSIQHTPTYVNLLYSLDT